MSEPKDLLFEIGCEELPASFVEAALTALPQLVTDELQSLRLDHGEVRALGTPRRLAVIVKAVAAEQPNLEEKVTGPPVKAAFKDGQPTKAAEAFAAKIGLPVEALETEETPKGPYLVGVRREMGQPTASLLPAALSKIALAIPFRKSMRWGSGSLAFGRPIRWLLALYGGDSVALELEGIASARVSYGHRFLHPGRVEITAPGGYVAALRAAHVVVDPDERRRVMVERLEKAAAEAGGTLIPDEFLVGENLSLVEDPRVVVGGFDPSFLALPDEVILEVARGHQRYFGLRGPDDKLMPRYLAVVNTAERPDVIRKGNDRVMRARLADAEFFHREDLKHPLASRRPELAGIVFQNELGSVIDKVIRIEKLVGVLAELLGLEAGVKATALEAAGLAKCDLVTWMVREFPELQGEVGRAYALEQGVAPAVADAIRDHYQPKGAHDGVAPSDASAIVALADRLDTLVGCFAIGLSPTGGADPYALRRACIATLRTLEARRFDVSLERVFRAAYAGYEGAALKLSEDAVVEKLAAFFRDRLRGLFASDLPTDAVDAALGVAADRPLDARARAEALRDLDAEVRARLGEVFKRATNIAKEAPEGVPERGDEPAEIALHERFYGAKQALAGHAAAGAYAEAFAELAGLAPVLGRYFDEVLVIAKDEVVRTRRLRLMRDISDTCSALARLELLGS
jgi:glycyl-tRNA synthetase beta chain